MRKSGMFALISLIAVFLLLGGCASESSQEQESPTAQTSAAPTPTKTPTPSPSASPSVYVPSGMNPLTGMPIEPEFENTRPAAVMINNLKAALPQHSVADADIIYEALAEGGITRMMAVFQDPSVVGDIGSVRSARTYYVELAGGLDAIYFHAGGSPDAYSKIRNWGVTALDCVNGGYEGTLYWRDEYRMKHAGYEHSVFTSGERIMTALEKVSRTDHADGYDNNLRFTDDGTPAEGTPAVTISLKYSYYKTGVFEYDAKTRLYAVSEYDEPYIDGEDDTQVAVTNVLILRTKTAVVDSVGRLSITLTGSGTGYYACGGKMVDITWSKQSHDSPFVYKLTDGTPLVLGRGKSYVNIFSTTGEFTAQ